VVAAECNHGGHWNLDGRIVYWAGKAMTQAITNPAGRLDVLLLRLAEEYTRRFVEPAVSRALRQPVNLWDSTLRPIVEKTVQDLHIPARPLTMRDVMALSAQRRRRCT
jgi:hypothetical protein